MSRTEAGNPADGPGEKSGETKRAPVSMRLTARVRRQLEESAAADGRSIAQEVEQRLERSLLTDKRTGSVQTARLVAEIVATIGEIEAETGKKWSDDLITFGAVRYAIREALDDSMPCPTEREADLEEVLASHEGAKVVSNVARDLAVEGGTPWLTPEMREDWKESFSVEKVLKVTDESLDKSRAFFESLNEVADQGIPIFEAIRDRRDAMQKARRRD